MIAALHLFLVMVGVHALCDYPLQGDFLAKAKNRSAPIPGVPWWQAMAAHAAIQALGVGLATGSAPLALAEFVAHFVIDDCKCAGKLSYNQDQALHLACKALWCVIYLAATGASHG